MPWLIECGTLPPAALREACPAATATMTATADSRQTPTLAARLMLRIPLKNTTKPCGPRPIDGRGQLLVQQVWHVVNSETPGLCLRRATTNDGKLYVARCSISSPLCAVASNY